MTRRRGELPPEEEAILGIERPSPEEEDNASRAIEEKVELRKEGIRRLMAQPWFREWLMGKLVGFNTFTMPFMTGPTGFPDPNATFFQMGMKAAGWHLWEEVDDLAPELASLMRREAGGAA